MSNPNENTNANELASLSTVVFDIADRVDKVENTHLVVTYVLISIIGLIAFFLLFLKLRQRFKTGQWYYSTV